MFIEITEQEKTILLQLIIDKQLEKDENFRYKTPKDPMLSKKLNTLLNKLSEPKNLNYPITDNY